VAAVVLAWPGWVTPSLPVSQDRRVAWRAEPDEAWKRAAVQIQRWREDGRLPESVHGFHTHPDLVNYCAWFAPKEKGFFDYRYSLLGDRSGDFVDVRRALKEAALEGKPTAETWAGVFHRYGIRYLMFSEYDPKGPLLGYIFAHPEEGAIWYLNGKVIIAG